MLRDSLDRVLAGISSVDLRSVFGTSRDKEMRLLVLSDFAAFQKEGEIVLGGPVAESSETWPKMSTRGSGNRRECWELKENVGDALNWVY